jgi:hypothetical protein
MGSCLSSDPNAQNNRNIKKQFDNWEQEEQAIRKLLLLGTGASGKSTVFKQLKCIHGDGIGINDFEESRSVIRQNCVSGLVTILRKANELYNQDSTKYSKCQIPLNDENISKSINTLIQHGNTQFTTENLSEQDLDNIAHIIILLWNLPCVQFTYQIRGNKFAFPENMEHFFQKVKQIMKPNYMPNDEDVFKTRIRTTGVIEYRFELNKQLFYVCDVGGQRNERKKWIHQFSEVTAVIFVAALNHYNALLFEDETKNAMHESIELFEDLLTSKFFKNTEMILFLNKDDLFKQQLRDEISLSTCFYDGWRPQGPVWKGNNYKKIINDESKDMIHFGECYEEARKFITDVYTNYRPNIANNNNNVFNNTYDNFHNISDSNNSLNNNNNSDENNGQFPTNKHIYVHVTCATDRDNVDKVFWDVQNMIIRLNLGRGGLLTNV